jgi:hypothetical protein
MTLPATNDLTIMALLLVEAVCPPTITTNQHGHFRKCVGNVAGAANITYYGPPRPEYDVRPASY